MSRLSDQELFERLGWTGSPEAFVAQQHESARMRFHFHPRNKKDFFFNLLTTSQSFESILEDADHVLENRFQTLGSPLTGLGNTIAWQKDFKSGKEWPLLPISELDVLDLDHPSDVKVPWELSRFHQVWWLGKASWISGDPRYAEKFRDLTIDWIEKNPPGVGVNWVVAMEVAIRACNWIAGYYFFCESPAISADFWVRLFRALLSHGLYIESHLEYSRVNGNHFLSNVVGLIYLGVFFRDLPVGRRWLRWGIERLHMEMKEQVYPDGVNHEKSTAYHRLVLEFFYSAALLCKRNGIPLEDGFLKRLEAMFEFVAQYTRPDGSIPLVGDADDGRLFRISMAQDINDHRHALAVGAILFRRSDFKSQAGRFDQEALWYFGGEGFEIYQMLQAPHEPPASRAFADGGFYIMRSESAHAFIDAGDLGMRGIGGHGHNDTLSFELWGNGSPLIVDSGTYGYTFDPAARNAFRGTAAHNTVMIDNTELADFAGLWSVREDPTKPVVLRWNTSSTEDLLVAEQFSYHRLPSKVTHQRTFRLLKQESKFEVTDELKGSDEHSFKFVLHFHPSVAIVKETARRWQLTGRTVRCILTTSHDWSLEKSLYSPSYGIRMENTSLLLQGKAKFPQVFSLSIALSPTETA